MPLAQHFKKEFSATTRQKGESYYRSSRVTVSETGEFGLEARVRGSTRSPYNVSLDWSDAAEGVLADCSCPHFESGNFCKHLWGTILAADQRGVHLPEGCLPELIHANDDFDNYEEEYDDDYDDLDDDEFADISAQVAGNHSLNRTSQRSREKRQQHSAAWDRQLGQWRATNNDPGLPAKTRPKRALFVLDVAASFQAGAVVLNLFQQEQRQDGEWGKAKILRVSRGKLSGFDQKDQRRLSLVLGNYTGTPWTYGRQIPLHAQYENQTSQVELVPTLHEWLLPELCAEERLGWVLSGEQPVEDRRPLVWDAGPPWEFRLVIADDPKRKCWTAHGELVQGKRVVPLAEAVLLLSSGLALFPESVARLSPPEDWRWLALLRSTDQLVIPHADRDKLLTELWAGGMPKGVKLPANLQVETSTVTPQGCLKIHAPGKQTSRYQSAPPGFLYADFHVEYAGRRIAPHDAGNAFFESESGHVQVRDRQAEAALWKELSGKDVSPYKPIYNGDPSGNVRFKQQHLNKIVDELTQAGWQVWAEGRQIKRAGEFRANVLSGVDWFDLETHIDFDGCGANLPQMLKALQTNDPFILLDDGSQGLLPREWLDKFAPLAEFAEIEGDRVRFRTSQALLLDALLEERSADVEVKVDRQFNRLREKLRSFAGVKPREAPAAFRGKLRPYQKDGLGWMGFLEEFGLNGCLADDMGLGKTVQVLAWLVARSRRRQGKPMLIVAPKSVVTNWQQEAERFAPRLKVLNFTGLERALRADQIGDAQVVLTTYGTLRRDVELLKEVHFDYVILDEAQAIKNDKSVSAKACRLLQADHRMALTGTPVENHLGDLWSIFEFLNPGMMGRSNALRSYTNGNGNGDGASLETLRRALAPFILRRTKEKVLKDLPKKTEQTLNVELLPADRKRYNELRDYYRDSLVNRATRSGMNAVRMHVLEALLRLRQVACHAGLVDKKLVNKPSAKLDVLLENIAEVVDEGHKALVFSQFTSLLTIVKSALDQRRLCYEYLDGRTRNRQERIDRFQSDPNCPLFLISLKAGGTGLNLTAADYVFLMDPWWNPAVEKQAIDRAHRIGQKRPVFAYRLVTSDTVEEKIIELQSKKRELADAIISGDKSVMSGLTLEDLRLLLS